MAPADRQEAKAHAPGPLSSQESQRFSEKAPETSGHLLKGQANFTQKKVAAPVLSPSTEEGAAVLRDSKNSSSNPSRFDSFQKADAAETKSGLTKPTQPDQRSGVLRDPDPVAERLSSSESITSSKGSVEPALPQISAQRPGVMAKMDATGLLFSDPGGSARGTLDQVRAFLERQSLTPPRELELQLEPKRLGKIRVQLSLQGDKIQALFRTETPQAMQVLRQGQGELEQSLRQSGHELSHFDVKQDSSPQQQSNQHGQNGQSALQSQGEGQGRHHRSAQGASPVPEQPQEMETDLLPVFREGSEELQREGLNVTA
jgi:flagellar hook-length control protein FliK